MSVTAELAANLRLLGAQGADVNRALSLLSFTDGFDAAAVGHSFHHSEIAARGRGAGRVGGGRSGGGRARGTK
ncbi:hypothetical protein, partial [Corynebacterium heidelbergense]